jgi:hypothetical protein
MDGDGKTWFRPSFQHELLHAFDFHHLQGQYTFMTHREPAGFPWANRPAADAVKLLPYEIGELRRIYPGSGTTYDVSLLNTWWGPPTDPDDNAGGQYQLCAPSLGKAYTPNDYDSGTCGTDNGQPGGTGAVCSGTTLRTRFTLANSSTTDMDVTATLTFDREDLPNNLGAASPTVYKTHLDAATSGLQQVDWTVPSVSSLFAYRPTVHITAQHTGANGSPVAASVRADSIPLSGTVRCLPIGTYNPPPFP